MAATRTEKERKEYRAPNDGVLQQLGGRFVEVNGRPTWRQWALGVFDLLWREIDPGSNQA